MNAWKFPKQVPDWYKDAKFGLFFHWGPYSVPAHENEWYSRQMYQKDHENNIFHKKTYGDLRSFGYKDFIPLLTGSRFSAADWADLVELSGAKYAGPVSEHADNFSLWDSALNPVNSVNMGPRRDVVGECFTEFRKRGIKCMAAFHHQWQWGWFMGSDTASDVYDPANELYYGPIVPQEAGERVPRVRPTDSFYRLWRDKVLEVVKNYQPDLVYFDSRCNLIPDVFKQQVCKAVYNRPDTIITCKEGDFPKEAGVYDIEVRRFPEKQDFYWQEDDKLETGSTWSYVEGGAFKTAGRIIHELCDIVAKNGNLLLNVGPKADGSFPEDAVCVLRETGDWLKVSGEAIYGTRPYTVCQEGPTDITTGYVIRSQDTGIEFVLEHTVPDLTARDVRYTCKGNAVYAIVQGLPEEQSIVLTALKNKPVRRISLLGSKESICFQSQENGLQIFFPKKLPCKYAYAFKIEE